MNPLFHARFPTKDLRAGTRGVALILTLSILVLVTIMVVSFVSVVSQDRGATQGYTQSQKAQELALSGLDQIVVQLQSQIGDPANNTATNGSGAYAVFVPKSTALVPQRMVADTLAPLLTLSGTNAYGTLANLASVGIFTTNTSANNRRVSIARWCKPQLLPPAVTNSFPVPSWIVMTRSGPRAFASGTSPITAGITASGFTNTSAAIGRYAYVVYDVGGLLDVNAVGYPSGAASSAPAKGVLPWADLSQLDSHISQADMTDLVKWRNPANAGSYASYVANWVTNGFMRVAPGDTTFLSRQELIKYVQTKNPDLAYALPYLTTFSRALNGPTWGPTTNLGGSYNYLTKAKTAGTTNPLIYNIKVGQSFVRQNRTMAAAGEPLVKYRFPLDKLALLEKQGMAGLSAQDKADILKYFGLVPAADSSGLYRHWIYTNPAGGASAAAAILTLDAVAALNREPDFFELLQAGILSGSLGQYGRGDAISNSYWPAGWSDPDKKADYQIMRIGANIIDQWDADSYPTTVSYDIKDFYGIEDLPYINEMFVKVIGTGAALASGIPGPPYAGYLYFELWNPHQQAGSGSGYPSAFRIAPLSPASNMERYKIGFIARPTTTSYWWYLDPGGAVWNTNASQTRHFTDLAGGGILSFLATAGSYREPALMPGSAAAWAGGPSISALTLCAKLPYPANGTLSSAGSTPWSAAIASGLSTACIDILVSAVFQIQYQEGTAWHTYGTFVGYTDASAQSGYLSDHQYTPVAPDASADAASFPKSDPRTFRFGAATSLPNPVGSGFPASAGVGLNPSAAAVNSSVWGGGLCPFLGSTAALTATAPYRLDLWSVNDATVAPQGACYAGAATPQSYTPSYARGLPYYLDPDGAQRPGDARYSYAAASASSPLFANAASSRPVVLNRPFQSVGELGFVFRDMPWKTLDLFSPGSADFGLLDLFALSEAPVVAGCVNPNTAPVPVLAALLGNALANYSGTSASLPVAAVPAVAAALVTAASTVPLGDRAALMSFATNSTVTAAFPSGIKTERETVVRALAESANVRTWNFLIDIIAQSGSYPATATTLDGFNVTGEHRLWLHVAIDRYTGQIVDRQLEAVNE